VLDGIAGAALISVGSDGTDGPTDAAGGYVDGDTVRQLEERGLDIQDHLENNDSYHALKAIGNLIITGPTGTNVNDLTIGLIHG
jgi:hydroxypyruvate reductase